jgi:type I restriction enzyme S subunit
VPAISRPTQSIKAIRFVLADAWFSNAFESMVAALFECRGGIFRESRKLAELRDYLLPKLLSGAVRVKEAERVLETIP